MKLYDRIITESLKVLEEDNDISLKKFPFEGNENWKCLENSEFIMQRDAAMEIGSLGQPSVNYTCVTTSGIVDKDETWLFGSDISEIQNGSAFARIVILETQELHEETDSEKAFAAIRNLDFVRYHVFPKGYMVRVSASSNQEQVRISKAALKNGISFAKVGGAYIKKYKAVHEVKNVRMVFVTDKRLVEQLLPNADKVDSITRTLTHILDGMPTDCGHCSMKAVCDEVEGMRELHLGGKKK